MRSRLIITASVLGLLAGPALAQSSSSSVPPATTAPGSMTSPTLPSTAPVGSAVRRPAADPLSMEDTSQIKGSTVYGSDDKKIGDVATVLMQPSSKTIDRLVVNEGGVLGVGGHRVALPVSDFKWNGDKDGFTIGKTADELKSMPEWKAASASGSVLEPSSGSSAPLKPQAPSNAGTSGDGSSTTE